jgi:hypothetical protein
MTTNRMILNRRHFAMTALGGFTALSLAACGGGGGDGDETSTINLRAAFDKIQYRMTKDEVRAIVGRQEDDAAFPRWSENNETLWVTFQQNDQNIFIATRVEYSDGSTRLDRSLNQGE